MAQVTRVKIEIANPPLDKSQRTYLSADAAAGVTSLTVLAKEGFFKADHRDDTYFYVLIGEYGWEKSEIVRITADNIANTTLANTGDATIYAHSTSEPITYIAWDQIKYYGMTASGGTKTLVETLAIDITQQSTIYTYEGTTYSYFVATYNNSDNTEESQYTDEITSSSFGTTSAKRVIEAGVRKALTQIDENPDSNLTWQIAKETLQDGIEEILARKRKWSFLHETDTSQSTTANTAYVSLPSDEVQIDFVVVNNKKCNWITPLQYHQLIYSGTTPVSTSEPTNWTRRDDLIYLYPTPNGTYNVIIDYYENVATITDLNTTIKRPFIIPLIYYCAAQFSYVKGNDKRGDKMYRLFEAKLERQVEEYTGPYQSGDAEPIEETSIYSGEADMFEERY
jgi:hypothetical protein